MVEGVPTAEEMKKFSSGLEIDGYKTAPAKISIIKKGKYTALRIIIHEGKNRQVRKMCAAIGHEVKYLKRVSTGKLDLGSLEKGKYRYLTEDEVKYLKSL